MDSNKRTNKNRRIHERHIGEDAKLRGQSRPVAFRERKSDHARRFAAEQASYAVCEISIRGRGTIEFALPTRLVRGFMAKSQILAVLAK